MVHLQSKNGLLISVLTTLCFFALVYSTSSEVLSPVSVEGFLLSEKENVHTLKFKVTNNGAAALTLEEFTLPWVEETRFLLLLAVTPDGTEISPYLPEVGMPMAGPVTLKVGESVEGNLSLNKR